MKLAMLTGLHSTYLVLFFILITQAEGNFIPKEHKVHNIVLYPDKHSWCKVTPIKQVISHTGCQTKNIDNNVCVGTCFSFSVPKTIPETPGDDQLHYCDSCQSSDSSWIIVSLDCPDDTNQPKVEKSVEIISNCSCISCQEKPHLEPRPADEEEEDYEEDQENLKQMYDTLKHVGHLAGRKNSAVANTPGHVSTNKHLDLLEEADDSQGEGEIDEETFRQAYNSGPLWKSVKKLVSAFFTLL
uniref:CTCK domain-containing protein n=1 Tax=Strigamia maritima TaxID=126957 RepID=T1JM76_STRMM